MLASANDCKIPQQSNEFPMCGGKVGVSMHDAMSVFDNCIITPPPPPPRKMPMGVLILQPTINQQLIGIFNKFNFPVDDIIMENTSVLCSRLWCEWINLLFPDLS